MKIKIRRSFETNSSSAHTFVLTIDNSWTTDNDITEYVSDAFSGNPVVINLSYSYFDFGQTFECLDTWFDKMRYLFLGFIKHLEFDHIENLILAVKKRIPNFKNFNITDNCIDDDDDYRMYSSRNKNFVNDTDYFSIDAAIDHQSQDIPENIIKAFVKDGENEVDAFYRVIFCNDANIYIMSDCSTLDEDITEEEFNNIVKILSEGYNYNAKTRESMYNPHFITGEEYKSHYNCEINE